MRSRAMMSSIQYGCLNINYMSVAGEARTVTPKKRKEGAKPLRTHSKVSWCMCVM